jgi:hypothetical protein
VWSFSNGGDDSSYFGRMPPAVVENLLWLYTEPGDIVVDPFAGGGTTIDVARRWGAGCVGERCVWYCLAIGRETLRSVWTVSKLRTHRAVTLTVIGRRVHVGEQIAGAKWAVNARCLKRN